MINYTITLQQNYIKNKKFSNHKTLRFYDKEYPELFKNIQFVYAPKPELSDVIHVDPYHHVIIKHRI